MPQDNQDEPRESSLWRSLSPNEAASVLLRVHETQAGEEALFRAFLAERDMESLRAGFWVQVYRLIRQTRA